MSGAQLACSKKYRYARVSQKFSFRIPSELYLLAWPHPTTFRRSCYIWKYINFFHIVVFYIKSKNFTIVNGIAFSMLLGPDERLQGCECPVAVWSVISDLHLSSQHPDGTYFWRPASQVGKEIIKNFAFCAEGSRGCKGNSEIGYEFQIIYLCNEFSVAHSDLNTSP